MVPAMKILEARWRLSQAARNYLLLRGFKLSLSGRIYLSLLLTRGALRVAREGRDSVETAEENLRALLEEAGSGMAAPEISGTPAF
jgi:hypothetical protein